MKNLILFVFTILLFGSCSEIDNSKKINQKPMQENIKTIKKEKLLRHIVMFKFKEEATLANINTVETKFAELKEHIPEIIGFEWGTNNSPEELEQGYTHCFFVTFENEAGRAIYLPHPKHLEFVEILKPHVEKALVFDYWTSN